MPKTIVPAAHRGAVILAALTSLTLVAVPIQTARSQARPSTPVTVENPVTLNPNAPNPVTIVEPPTVSVIDVNRPSAQPVYVQCNQIVPSRTCVFNYTVPAGKTLVVTNVSYQIQYPLSDAKLTAIQLSDGNFSRSFYLPVAPTLNNVPNQVATNGSTVSFGMETHYLFFTGEGVEMFWQQTQQNPAFSILQSFTISGHLEDTQ
jgi:hypothetical protein